MRGPDAQGALDDLAFRRILHRLEDRDGRGVEAITLGDAQGLQAELLTYGAILRRLTYPVNGRRRDLVLSLPTLEDYVRDRAYVGALVGRFGNRIANGRFSLDGREYQVTCNEGVNHLHGGALGFGKRLWRVLRLDQSATPTLELGLVSPAGEEGYPGRLDVTVTLAVLPARALEVVKRAVATMPRWRVESESPEEIRLTRRTRTIGFVDDVVVAAKPAGPGTILQAARKSRVGIGDLGQNRRNILELWAAIRAIS